ncbi:hypothetical protein E2562_036555 [Oryza meyeriana var. granulata]|uniref:Uncharacterized protein n=1 Tax=Oryza meyeriana var. granulata TaxID=110450 RepID=A0A6G1CAZ3_9ORYZ|nr:hypothetical protein E2562_036555 [Oryza meyeriana var. granulata]
MAVGLHPTSPTLPSAGLSQIQLRKALTCMPSLLGHRSSSLKVATLPYRNGIQGPRCVVPSTHCASTREGRDSRYRHPYGHLASRRATRAAARLGGEVVVEF